MATPIWAYLLMGLFATSGVGLVAYTSRTPSKICEKCKREMEAAWTNCLFCGHNPSLAGGSGKPAILHFVTGPLKDQIVYLEKSITTIGSVRGNDVIIQDTVVSRKHVGIRKVDGGYELADFGSTNGVFVNGEKIPRKKLNVGDIIRVGTTEIIFRT